MRSFVLVLVVTSAAIAHADDKAFDALVDGYYAEHVKQQPTSATGLGLHAYDAELEDVTAAGMKRQIASLKRWQQKLASVNAGKLSPARAADLTALRSSIEAQLIEDVEIQGWRHQPDFYSGLASRSVYVIIKRDFAPTAERIKLVIARETKIPALLTAAEHNLADVPRVSAEIALEELPGIVDFFTIDVPLAFSSVKDAALKAELARTTELAAEALRGYEAFLREKILPHAKDTFAIGEAKFRAKLKAEDMIEEPIDALLQRGEAELHRLQAEFKRVAAQIDPKKPFVEVQREMQKNHDDAAHLISGTQARLAGLRRFLVERHIVTLPSEVMPRVQETPPFERATSFASMDTPGPFEPKATEAYFNVTLPDKSWPAAQAEDYLRGAFSRPTVEVTAIHEAFPGHYTQFIWLPTLSSTVRKYEGASTNMEGWAHYCEQMLLDEGYGGGDPKLRLAQLQDALLRAARYVVGIRMHTRGMTFAQGVEFFQNEGYQSPKVAEMETRRGTEDPTYLYYTLGKLEILKLRDDYKRKLGAAYTLQKFHDAFLAEGGVPLPLVRAALLR
jgi:uncharacterized protein (DUF885 family)